MTATEPAVDPTTPVLIGAGQISASDRAVPVSMRDLVITAAQRALADAGTTAAELRDRVQLVGVADCLTWRPDDAGRSLATAVGASPRETIMTRASGTSPLDLLSETCQRIHTGEFDTALLAGGEAVRALNDGLLDNGAEEPAGSAPTRVLGSDRHANHPAEEAAELRLPVHYYPLFENALRAAAGRGIAEHQDWLARLWARFADVATTNPYAWDTSGPTAADIGDPGQGNRMVSFPYRKFMIANILVNQAAALVVCSAGAAEQAGVPRDRWIFVHGTAAGNDHWYVGERAQLHRSPAINAIGRALCEHTGIAMADIAHRDLYSCFPSAVQVAAAELDIDLEDPHRPPTVTGGLTFAGGPGSNYVMHSLASLVELLRRDPTSRGLATATGWYLTKHAAAVLSAHEPARNYTHHDVQTEVDRQPARKIAENYTGIATIETYTVSYDRNGTPDTGHLVCLTEDGSRTFAMTQDPGTMAQLLDHEPIGREVHLPDCTLS